MDPSEILVVRFHFGGEFKKIGPNLDYVGGDVAQSEIERDKLSLQEVKRFVKVHLPLKESMRFYFLIPRKDLVDGLVLLYDDSGCVKIADYVCFGGVADVYIEFHGEKDNQHSSCGIGFKNEVWELSDGEEEQDAIISAVEPAESATQIFKPDDTCVITHIVSSTLKQKKSSNTRPVVLDSDEDDMIINEPAFSQFLNPTQGAAGSFSRQNHHPTARSQPAARTGRTQAPKAGRNFKSPRKRTATSEAVRSSVPAKPGASSSRGRGAARAKRGKRVAASQMPMYSYFTCSGNY
jgi:hypothetical protein